MHTTETPRKIDVSEHGMDPEGSPSSSNRRLFMQLQVYSECQDSELSFQGTRRKLEDVVARIEGSEIEAVIYQDLNHPQGMGLLTMHEDPATFVTKVRPLLNQEPFSSLTLRPEFTMLGRSYASGYEPDLEEWLLQRPRRTVLNPEWPWAVWYPLRRTGAFNAQPENVQKSILREHGGIGRLYGQQDLAHDVRLACHGLDTNDNEFVIGLVGKDLHPLSHLVQRMRRTRQTSEFMQQMGPFFVGRAFWQSPSP